MCHCTDVATARKAELGEFAFTTDDPSDIELRPSEVAVVERGVLFPNQGDQAVAFVRLHYTSPDARGNAAHLFEYRATVDGQPTFVTNTDGVLGVEVHTVCNQYTQDFTPGMCGGLYSVPPGWHVVEVRSHVLGEAEDPEPVQLAIETRCPRDVEREADSAISSPDQAIDSDEAAPDGARASGCAFRRPNVAGGLGVLGLLLVLARRRRNLR